MTATMDLEVVRKHQHCDVELRKHYGEHSLTGAFLWCNTCNTIVISFLDLEEYSPKWKQLAEIQWNEALTWNPVATAVRTATSGYAEHIFLEERDGNKYYLLVSCYLHPGNVYHWYGTVQVGDSIVWSKTFVMQTS